MLGNKYSRMRKASFWFVTTPTFLIRSYALAYIIKELLFFPTLDYMILNILMNKLSAEMHVQAGSAAYYKFMFQSATLTFLLLLKFFTKEFYGSCR